MLCNTETLQLIFPGCVRSCMMQTKIGGFCFKILSMILWIGTKHLMLKGLLPSSSSMWQVWYQQWSDFSEHFFSILLLPFKYGIGNKKMKQQKKKKTRSLTLHLCRKTNYLRWGKSTSSFWNKVCSYTEVANSNYNPSEDNGFGILHTN